MERLCTSNLRMKHLIIILVTLSAFSLCRAYFGCPIQSYESGCSIGNIEQVKFPGGQPAITKDKCNAQVDRSNVSSSPTEIKAVMSGSILNDQRYTVVMIDPDYRNPPVRGRPYLMWILSNVLVQGGDFKLSDGTKIADYRAPNFQYNGQTHRVVILAFKQTSAATFISTPVNDYERPYFNLALWLYRNRDYVSCTPSGGFQVTVP